jgi:hypothetical protein
MDDARNINFVGNTIYDFYEKGLKATQTTFVTLKDNSIGHIYPSWTLGATFFDWKDFKGGCVSILDNFDMVV